MRTCWSFLAALVLSQGLAISFNERADAATSPRAALVIGNAAYPDGDEVLKTPVGDADLIAKMLAQKTFAVETVKNGTRKQIDAAITRFLDGVGQGTSVAIFYAGYGIQVARRNYLVPVDARIWSEADVLRDGIAVDALLADAARRGAETRIVILDASRRNPFERRFRSLSAGLAASTPRPGVLTLSSTAAGAVLADSDGPTSLFADELRKQMDVSPTAAEQAFEATRDDVSRASQGQEVPAVVSGLEIPFYFDPARKAPPPKVATATSPGLGASLEPQTPAATVTPTPKASAPTETSVQAPKPEPAIAASLPTPAAKPPMVEQSVVEPLPLRPLQPEAKPPAANQKPAAAESKPAGEVKVARVEPKSTPASAQPPADTLPATDVPKLPAASAATSERPIATPYEPEETARRAALGAIITRNPRDLEALAERGRMFAQHGDLVAAIADFDRVLKVAPGNVEALNNRCWARAVRNELQVALGDCNEALRLRHDYADAYDSRGMIYLKTGQPRAALADYEAAIKIDPSHSSAIYGRGLARYRLGDKELAARDFTAALGLNGTIDRQYAQYGVQ